MTLLIKSPIRAKMKNMRMGRRPKLFLNCTFAAVVGVGFAAGSGHTQPYEYVITFDNVVVRGTDPTFDSPEAAHRELPGLDKLLPSAEEKSDQVRRSDGPIGQAPKGDNSSRQSTRGGSSTKGDSFLKGDSSTGPPPKLTIRIAGSLLPFEPGTGTENPSFVQEGFLVESFWAGKIGTREGFFKRAHFHPNDLSSGFEGQHLGNPDELHGLYIRSLDGKRFGVKSLRYRVTRNRQIPTKPLSIEGFSTFNVNVLIGRFFDPRTPIRIQFTALPIGLPVGNDLNLPWFTLRIFGFQLVDQVYIASTASVDFDDIVLTKSEPPPPAPDRKEEDK